MKVLTQPFLRAIAICGICLSFTATAAIPISAQEIEQGRYQDRMVELAGHLGTLHHLRGSCMESERQTWRNYMQEMIRIEDPSADRKTEMVAQFNAGYESAKRSYRECDGTSAREAERVARIAASQSDAIAEAVQK